MTTISFDDFPPIHSLQDKGEVLALESAYQAMKGCHLFLRKSRLGKATELIKIIPYISIDDEKYSFKAFLIFNWSGIKYPSSTSPAGVDHIFITQDDPTSKALEEEIESGLMKLAHRLIVKQAESLNNTKCAWEKLLGPIPSPL